MYWGVYERTGEELGGKYGLILLDRCLSPHSWLHPSWVSLEGVATPKCLWKLWRSARFPGAQGRRAVFEMEAGFTSSQTQCNAYKWTWRSPRKDHDSLERLWSRRSLPSISKSCYFWLGLLEVRGERKLSYLFLISEYSPHTLYILRGNAGWNLRLTIM